MTAPLATSPFERNFTFAELAILLGCKDTKARNYVRKGILRAVKIGTSVRIPESEVTRYFSTLKPATYKPAKAA